MEIYTLVAQSIDAVNTGEQSPEEALAIAQERANEVLIQYGCEM